MRAVFSIFGSCSALVSPRVRMFRGARSADICAVNVAGVCAAGGAAFCLVCLKRRI